MATRAINEALGTNLTPAEVDELPQEFIDKLMLFAKWSNRKKN